MELTVTKLWNKNFIMLTIGQVVSLFANGILRFAMPLYILYASGSPELMGRVMALSIIPTILVSPFGGALADRLNKKRVIVFLDFFTAAITFAYLWSIGFLSIVPLTVLTLMLYSAIKSAISSATDASFPLIVPSEELSRANSVNMSINTLSMTLGPLLGGILLAEFGLESILIVSGICLTFAAVMELFIHIPKVKQVSTGNMFADVIGDIGDGIRFAIKKQPIMAKMFSLAMAINFILPGIAFIGIPVLITQNLDMSERMVGISHSVMGAGGVVGGIVGGILGQKLRIQKGHLFFVVLGILILPMGLVFFVPTHTFLAYSTMTAMLMLMFGTVTMFSITVMTFIQHITPSEMLGKMMGLFMTATLVAQPLGNWVAGFLFEQFADNSSIIFFSAALLTILTALWSRKHFKGIPLDSKMEANKE
ncbi:MAG: MFS transporter [Firmicutes bacterium]|nr:MFS transporter [Bacillota bacterium]